MKKPVEYLLHQIWYHNLFIIATYVHNIISSKPGSIHVIIRRRYLFRMIAKRREKNVIGVRIKSVEAVEIIAQNKTFYIIVVAVTHILQRYSYLYYMDK